MEQRTLICDRCRRPAPRLHTLDPGGDLCLPCVQAAVGDLCRAGALSVTVEMPAAERPARVLRVRRG